MQFVNETGLPATLARAKLLYRDLMMATVVVKASFQVEGDGSVALVEDQLPVFETDVATDLGTVDCDVVPVKAGCDVGILGHARSPAPDERVTAVALELTVGAFSRRLRIVGDRRWVSSMLTLQPSAPEPFTALPLTYERAFGGSAIHHEELAGPYAPNPRGRGYVRLRRHAEGTTLPNIEEWDQLVSSWEDTPLPGGVAPLPRDSSLRLEGGGFGVDLENELVQLGPAAFSSAHPRMMMDRYPAGEALVLCGVTHHAPWRFACPPLALAMEVSLGRHAYALPLRVDTLCLLPDYRRFYVVARRAVVYQVFPGVRRCIRVAHGAADAPAGVTTIAAMRQDGTSALPIAPVADPADLPLPFDAMLALYPLTRIIERLPLCASG